MKQSLVYNTRSKFTDMHLTFTRDLVLPWDVKLKGFSTLILGAFAGLRVCLLSSLYFVVSFF